MSACSVRDWDGEQRQHGDLGQHAEQGLGGGLEAALDEPEHTDRPGEPEPDRRPNGQSGSTGRQAPGPAGNGIVSSPRG